VIKKLRALIVEDNEDDALLLLRELKKGGFQVEYVRVFDKKGLLDNLIPDRWDIAFIDFALPEMNGVDVLRLIKFQSIEIPRIMISGTGGENVAVEAMRAGASDYIIKDNLSRLVPAVERELKERKMAKAKARAEEDIVVLNEQLALTLEDVRRREKETLRVLSRVADYFDMGTGRHVSRVGQYARMLARMVNMSEVEQELIEEAAPLHDIGKIGIPPSILQKPGKLTDAEFTLIKEHSRIGHDILKDNTSNCLQMGSIIALTHHERYDGTGYPGGLKREMIPIEGRITAIADVFDALTSDRPYHDAWPFAEAIEYLHKSKKSHFDPILVDFFIANIVEVEKIFNQNHD